MTIEHVNISDPEIHEPKGFATANAGDVYMSDGAGSGTLVDTSELIRMGVYNYDDLGTVSSPIAIAVSTTPTKLTNDGAGALTILGGALSDVPNIWDVSTNFFDFTSLNLYDKMDLRIDLNITTTSANTVIETFVTLDIGGLDIELKVDEETYKSTGTYEFTTNTTIYAFSEAVRTGDIQIGLTSDSGSATCEVNGWACTVSKRGLI